MQIIWECWVSTWQRSSSSEQSGFPCLRSEQSHCKFKMNPMNENRFTESTHLAEAQRVSPAEMMP